MAAPDDKPTSQNVSPDHDADASSSDDESGSSDQETPKVEWLVNTRTKRSTAGNRMKSMLAAEDPEDDDELQLLFEEAEDDAGFVDEGKNDVSDVQMDSSSDDDEENDDGDDDEGEKELQQEERAKKAAARKRKAQEAIPSKFRKKVRIRQPDTASVSSAAAPKPPRPKKKSERTSWLPSPADMPTRSSERKTTKLSKEQLHQQMIEREARRKKQIEVMRKKAEKLEALKKPPMTQAERLKEAAIVEKRNSKSLNRWEEAEKQREEERLAKLAALNNRRLDGPVVTFWSGIIDLSESHLKHVGKMVSMEEKPKRKRHSTAAAPMPTAGGMTDDTPAGTNTLVPKDGAAPRVSPPESAPPNQPALLDSSSLASGPPGPPDLPGPPDPPESSTTSTVHNPSPLNAAALTPPSPLASHPQQAEPPTTTVAPTTTSSTSLNPQPLNFAPPGPHPVSASQPEQRSLPTPTTLSSPIFAPVFVPSPALLDPVSSLPPAQTDRSGPSPTLIRPPHPIPLPPPPAGFLAPPAGMPGIFQGEVPMLGFSPAPSGMSNFLAAPNTSQSPSPAPTPSISPPRSLSQPSVAPPPPSPVPPQEPAQQASLMHTTASFQPIPQMVVPHDSSEKRRKSVKHVRKQTQTRAPPKRPVKEDTPPPEPPMEGKVTRSCILLQNFDEDAIKHPAVQTQILFGRRMDKLGKPPHPPLCSITHRPARYRDPKTGLPFYNVDAYRKIQALVRGDFKWSQLLGSWVGTGKLAAKGVPERFLHPERKREKPPTPPPEEVKTEDEPPGSMGEAPVDSSAKASVSTAPPASLAPPVYAAPLSAPAPPPEAAPAAQADAANTGAG